MSVNPSSAARLTLLTGPPGSGKSEAVLARIRETATTAGQRGRGASLETSALLLLPTYAAVQHTLRAALARWDARGLFDAPFVTFTSAGERFLPGFRVRSLPSQEERDRLLLSALERVDPPVYRSVRGTRGLRARLLQLLKEVKQSAAPPADALAALCAKAPRLRGAARERLEGFLTVAAAYGEALSAAGLEDHEDVLHRLLAGLRQGGSTWTPALLAVDGFDDMTPVEEAILEALIARMRAAGGEVLVALPDDPARPDLYASAAGLRARLTASGFSSQHLGGFERAPGGALEHLAMHLFGASASARPGGSEVLSIEALDAADEADRVARAVRGLLEAAEAPGSIVRGARDVLVVVPDVARRGPRLEAALERLGVPVHRGGARPLGSEPWARALAGLLEVLGGRVEPGDFPAAGVLDVLRWRALGGDCEVPLEAVDAQEMHWRTQGYPAGWEALRGAVLPALRGAIEEVEVQRQGMALAVSDPAGALLAALDRLLPLPVPRGLAADGRPLDLPHDRRVAAALAARAEVGALVRERVAAAARLGRPPTCREAALDLHEALARATFEPVDRRLDVVHVLDPDAARSWEAAVVFVAGLDEDGLPRRPSEDPLLGDGDRAQLAEGADALPTSDVHAQRETRRCLALLTRARSRLVLVRATRTPEGDDLPRSRLLAEVERVVTPTLEAALRGPADGVPALAACRTPADLLRFAAARSARPGTAPHEAAAAAALIRRLDPDLLRRAARWRRRAADPLGPDATARFEASVRRVPATSLNTALGCLQRHFLERILGLGRDEALLSGPRFGARDMGSLVHAALKRALLAPAEAADAVAAAVLEGQRVSGFEREHTRRELERIVRLFREREAATAGPLAPALHLLEHSLGGAEGGIVLGEGADRFLLTGRIDRVDVAGERAVIVDYKLGSAVPEERRRATLDGDDVQLPLYARALEREAGRRVVGLEWVSGLRRNRAAMAREDDLDLFEVRREGPGPVGLAAGAWEALLEVAERRAGAIVARIRAGDHDIAPSKPALCSRCPVVEACRPDHAHLRRVALAAGQDVGEEDDV